MYNMVQVSSVGGVREMRHLFWKIVTHFKPTLQTGRTLMVRPLLFSITMCGIDAAHRVMHKRNHIIVTGVSKRKLDLILIRQNRIQL